MSGWRNSGVFASTDGGTTWQARNNGLTDLSILALAIDPSHPSVLFAGTQNLTGVLEVRVTRAGQDTTLGRVRELILAAEKTKLPIMRIIDQYVVYYTPLVLVLGALVWAFTRDLDRVITVIVIGLALFTLSESLTVK